MSKYDSIIIGGGHNGLVCAAYLSKNKKKVLLIEQKEVLGGLAKYSDFTTSFSKKIIKDLNLENYRQLNTYISIGSIKIMFCSLIKRNRFKAN